MSPHSCYLALVYLAVLAAMAIPKLIYHLLRIYKHPTINMPKIVPVGIFVTSATAKIAVDMSKDQTSYVLSTMKPKQEDDSEERRVTCLEKQGSFCRSMTSPFHGCKRF